MMEIIGSTFLFVACIVFMLARNISVYNARKKMIHTNFGLFLYLDKVGMSYDEMMWRPKNWLKFTFNQFYGSALKP